MGCVSGGKFILDISGPYTRYSLLQQCCRYDSGATHKVSINTAALNHIFNIDNPSTFYCGPKYEDIRKLLDAIKLFCLFKYVG